MRIQATHIGVRDEHAPTFGRQNLTLWSGPFCSTFEGWAHELPGHDGFMINFEYGDKIRVTCPAPRTGENHIEVDDALEAAFWASEAARDARNAAEVSA